LDGFFPTYACTDDAIVTPDLDRPSISLAALYAGMRFIRSAMWNLKSVQRYKAGPVEYETQQGATVLTAVLASLRDQKNLAINRLRTVGFGVAVSTADAYVARSMVGAYWQTRDTGLPVYQPPFGYAPMGDPVWTGN
jgi:hypothetical protein